MSAAIEEIENDDDDDDVVTPTRRRIRDENDASLLDYLKSLSSDTPIKVTVIRELPKTWQGRSIEGTLDSFEEPISEEDVRDLFGGGKYKFVIYTPNSKGSWVYATSRTRKIAGDPKIDGLITTAQAPNNATDDSPSVVRDAMRMSAQMVERAQKQADLERDRISRGPDPALSMVMEELRASRADAATKDAKLLELASMKRDSAAEMLLGKAIEGESARIQAIQLRMDSELRMRAEMSKAEIDRLHQRYEDIARRQEDSHRREIDNLRIAHENSLNFLKTSYEGQIEGFKREISHLDRQLTVAQSESTELRAKKDKSLLESITEMSAMKEAMEAFGGGSKEEDGGSPWERIANIVMGSSLMDGIGSRLAGSVASEAMQAAPRQPEEESEIPINRPIQLPDGRVIVRKSDGSIMQIRRKEAATTPSEEISISVSDEDISVAVQFMEAALSHDADPSEFARTARSLAPSLTQGPIQKLLKTQGVDAFLDRVSKLSPNSPLLQQYGKNWVRKVAASLLES